jgi:hypothetical protein
MLLDPGVDMAVAGVEFVSLHATSRGDAAAG